MPRGGNFLFVEGPRNEKKKEKKVSKGEGRGGETFLPVSEKNEETAWVLPGEGNRGNVSKAHDLEEKPMGKRSRGGKRENLPEGRKTIWSNPPGKGKKENFERKSQYHPLFLGEKKKRSTGFKEKE